MDTEYNPHKIEPLVQQQWQAQHSFECDEPTSAQRKFYCVSMFPYPSGKIHMGHVRNYVITDMFARFHRQLGEQVLQPFGWDAFGLPAENAALQRQIAPSNWTYQNIAQMREALCRLGLSIDWRRELATCRSDYYRFEQELFLWMYQQGLAYRKKSVVNWDPVDQTVLANEQVVDGRGWRSGALVERREIDQWFLKITAYAEELLQDLDQLEQWPAEVKTMQRNWIGRSEGAEVQFQLSPATVAAIASAASQDATTISPNLTIYTTRLDTIFGVSYLAIAVDHPLAQLAAQQDSRIAAFVERFRHLKVAERDLATLSKEGIQTPWAALHPLTGAPIPIWIANFVLMDYGSGAVMAVPAHDQRDFEFARQYQLPIIPVIKPATPAKKVDYQAAAWTEAGVLFNSGTFDGLTSNGAKSAILNQLMANGQGQRKIHYRLRDWGISRQRYWGAPIPIIYCPHCGVVPVPSDQLPVLLPEAVTLTSPHSPLLDMPSFYAVTCPQCGAPARRETDTFDTFMESSWYFLRYCSFDCASQILDQRVESWLPVDLYVGGIEHAILHLLYARFIHKVIRDRAQGGYRIGDEPFKKLLTQGMVLKDGAKMSKSKGNVVEPGAMIEQFGSDTVRLFIIFAAPPEQALEWSQSGVEGAYRFLKRVYAMGYALATAASAVEMDRRRIDLTLMDTTLANDPAAQTAVASWYQLLAQISKDMQEGHLNTVVSGAMKLFNLLQDWQRQHWWPLLSAGFATLLRVLYGVVPHLAHYLWQAIGFGANRNDNNNDDDSASTPRYDIVAAGWPQLDTTALAQAQITIIIQVNGKMRDKISIASAAISQEEICQQALAQPKVQQSLAGQSLRKVVWVPGRLLNLVT